MKFKVMSVRDRAIEAFGRPVFVTHVGGALRGFSDEVNSGSKESGIASHPDDYELYELGSFDDSNCKFELLEVPRMVAIGKDLVKSKA